MRDVITMWRHTRMVVLVALIAAVYAAVLIPFKVAVPIAPGFTEFRPANVIPIVCSLLFGPAAAWGAAIGNLIGDLFGGTFGLGSFFGFVGNFLYGLLPYKLWGRMGFLSSKAEPGMASLDRARPRERRVLVWGAPTLLLEAAVLLMYLPVLYPNLALSEAALAAVRWFSAVPVVAAAGMMVRAAFGRQALEFMLVTLAACLACAVMVGWGVDILGLLPFSFIGNVVFINNLVVTLLLGPPLLAAVAPRVRRWGLRYTDILDEEETRPGPVSAAGVALAWVGAAVGFAVGNAVGLGLGTPFLAAGDVVGHFSLGVSVGVPVAVLILGCLLM